MYIFIYDEVMLKEIQDKMKLPMKFISFALLDDWKMIKYKKRMVITPKDFIIRGRGGNRIFGTIWKLEEPYFYIRILDAYYACSLSRIFENHPFDTMHRVTLETYPLYVDSIYDLLDEKFYTYAPMRCSVWIANQENKKFVKRVAQPNTKVQNGCIPSMLDACMKEVM